MDVPIAAEVIAAAESARGKVVKCPPWAVAFPSGQWNGPRVLTRSRFRKPRQQPALARTENYPITANRNKGGADEYGTAGCLVPDRGFECLSGCYANPPLT